MGNPGHPIDICRPTRTGGDFIRHPHQSRELEPETHLQTVRGDRNSILAPPAIAPRINCDTLC